MGTMTYPKGTVPPRTFEPEVLFVIFDGQGQVAHYVRTPDGRGAYWYDSDQEDEARGDVADPVAIHYFDDLAEFEEFREEHGEA